MKRTLFTILSALCISGAAFAQDVFYPGFQWGLKGGASYTIGETSDFGRLTSPAASIDLGWQFSRLFTLRADIAGWEGKGVFGSNTWKVQYVQLAADAKFDIINIFARQYHRHVVNPYLFIGVGGQYRFNNTATLEQLPAVNLLGEFKKFSYVGRLGAGIDFQVCKDLAVVLEYVWNATDDTFNSKKGDYFDHNMSLLLGVNFTIGQGNKMRSAQKSAPAPVVASAADAAAATAAATAAVAAAAVPAAVPAVVAAAPVAAAAVQEEADPKAAALAAALIAAKEDGNNVFYLIGKYQIRDSESAKINAMVEKLKANPQLTVTLCGFADKQTGNPDLNMILSENRAKGVYKQLVAAGIDSARIATFWYGDTVSISDIASRNRVTVMVSE